ncbi:hypothetical protein QWZ10_05965 [Paracoccus cavernae]|uniref:Uncharacterized protein n=1 Tax=Paracoccus cavernae TaxID=1571207 RepID=A0ABT8D6C9_9RHOB|nr:hypothetical protein [Paracoccus cavernae]
MAVEPTTSRSGRCAPATRAGRGGVATRAAPSESRAKSSASSSSEAVLSKAIWRTESGVPKWLSARCRAASSVGARTAMRIHSRTGSAAERGAAPRVSSASISHCFSLARSGAFRP